MKPSDEHELTPTTLAGLAIIRCIEDKAAEFRNAILDGDTDELKDEDLGGLASVLEHLGVIADRRAKASGEAESG